jgi:hypothetical protein
MGFFTSSFRARVPAVGVQGAVFAVGWRAHVARSEGGPVRVRLTDDAGTDGVTSLAAGSEVEILAWRPLGCAGARYRVRSTGTGLEGWLPAGNLRRPPAAAPSPKSAPRSTEKVATAKLRPVKRRGPCV